MAGKPARSPQLPQLVQVEPITLLPIAEAQRRLRALAEPVATERVSLAAAAGRWAAEDVRALRTQPAADLSSMDGYAIRFADLPGPWRVVGESAAGRPFAGAVGSGEAARIFTGAAMPDGADTVLIQEEAGREPAPAKAGDDALRLAGKGPGRSGGNTRPRGLDFTEGDLLVSKGARLTPARIAVAATGGHGVLLVHRPVRVAITATGDELVPPGSPEEAGKLPEANGVMLAAMLADLPVEIVDLGILPDDVKVLSVYFSVLSADLLITTGGASVGDHDLVRPALEAAGGQIDFWRVAVRPGKPMMAGRLGQALVLGLPGNPVSAFVTTLLFARPLIAHLAGAADPLPRRAHALLGEDLPANGPREDYLRAAHDADGRVRAAAIQDSSMLRTLARADCLIVRAPYAPAARAGDSAEILHLC